MDGKGCSCGKHLGEYLVSHFDWMFPLSISMSVMGHFVRFQQDDHAFVVAFMLNPDVHTYLRVVDLVRQDVDMVTGR